MEKVGTPDYFPTQRAEGPVRDVKTIGPVESSLGAPFGPIPAEFKVLPERFDVCAAPPSPTELAEALDIRNRFLIPDYPAPYLNDILRAFRLLRGLRTYIEIGTFDRGNLGYVSTLLADDALLIGVDTQNEEQKDCMLRDIMKRKQQYVSVVGDSRLPETVELVTKAAAGRQVDAIFIDGDHTAYGAMCDYVNYGSMVRSGGIILLHDALWEGDATYKGVSHTLREIDRFVPVYLIPGSGHCYRFMPVLFRDAVWGTVGCCFVP